MTETDLQPDPSLIGDKPDAPFALPLDPAQMFRRRAERFSFLATGHDLGDYLRLLAGLAQVQAELAETLPPVAPLPADRVAKARAGNMPPIDRKSLRHDPALAETLAAFCAAAERLDMPEPARLALRAVAAADESDRQWLLENLLTDTIPEDSAAPHLFAACAVELHLSRLAATLDHERLVPVHIGTCPACGGKPVTSTVLGGDTTENLRFCSCASCATRWHEVRIKCLCCGSTKGISYRAASPADADADNAIIKAECCAECKSWVKILYNTQNVGLDPVADDVGSLGLDLLMRDTVYARGGFHPFLTGY
ncbi:MAG: formate dehydrogenase accessory protein FdhE [Paracoccus sp. (in: a-proteobacteria)]|uniref:formate dehydrogenase accessory protein FdhE n=1 Tax=Paracoccus sp. TaxID=267 RepID=UPI0026DEE39A|nr:formate dehydrogenase accessory protein FdhE [Paracoccus sp. (in: a-proteobacteria)]MDO5622294.1 formate dehydrogenase accessory protein FdhE [Paracoccus sp. (in: a-proteobacteria)]